MNPKALHVFPVDDPKPHGYHDCWCLPTVSIAEFTDGMILAYPSPIYYHTHSEDKPMSDKEKKAVVDLLNRKDVV